MSAHVRVARVYDPPDPAGGHRVLVDRVWPRGLTKADAALDDWARDLAPSTDLRRWYGHDPARFDEFRRRYQAELREHAERLRDLRSLARRGAVTVLTASRAVEISNAQVVAEVLRRGR